MNQDTSDSVKQVVNPKKVYIPDLFANRKRKNPLQKKNSGFLFFLTLFLQFAGGVCFPFNK